MLEYRACLFPFFFEDEVHGWKSCLIRIMKSGIFKSIGNENTSVKRN